MPDGTGEQRDSGATLPATSAPNEPAPSVAPPRPPPNLTPVKIVDGRAPFPLLAALFLTTVPRPGDLISILANGRKVSYRASFVNFDPFDNDAHVTLGCLPVEAAPNAGLDDAALKQRMDEIVANNLRLFEKAEAYSKVVILAGYAGLFGVWSFAKDGMTPRATASVAILAGLSLIVYVAWETFAMARRATLQFAFNRLVPNTPAEFFKAYDAFTQQVRAASARESTIWRFVLAWTVGFGLGAALLLLWNCLAKLTGLPPWP